MSRIIVKNLPNKITTKQLSEEFSKKGCITDLQLKYTKSGVFRNFAFIGYKTEQEAKDAQHYFHNTYLHASKIEVEICSDLGAETKTKSWSKLTQDKTKTSNKRTRDITTDSEGNEKKKEKKKKKGDEVSQFPEEFQNDEQFVEFLKLNEDRKSKPLWGDDAFDLNPKDEEQGLQGMDQSKRDDGDDANDDDVEKTKEMTDLEYMRSKMKPSSSEKMKKLPEIVTDEKKNDKVFDDSFTVTLRNLPIRCKKKQIKDFFNPFKIVSLRFPPKLKGFAYVKFKTEKDMNCALNKNKGILGGHKVSIVKYERKEALKMNKGSTKNEETEDDKEKNAEILAESGRLFIRNLCFDVKEDELKEQFEKYGPLAEIHVPIDSYTKKGQGFAFISYVFAEHAVKAYSEFDGTIFQGRVMHIIPGRPKKDPVDINELPYKKKKDAKLKEMSMSSHNWNTLFLGQNAVADAMAKRYNIDKNELLNNEDKESIAVRMALCETQLVKETREFLIENGVQLDAFSQAARERSKNIIIAKNLPANTTSSELRDIFSKHGVISRLIIPPVGVTALIEFPHVTEAKAAFKKLAYSRFRHLPLYLEWAPINVLKENAKPPQQDLVKASIEKPSNKITEKSEEIEKAEDFEPEGNTTIFVRNVNFKTVEEELKKHFKKCGPLHSVTISKKKNIQTGEMQSMGFGFVQFKKRASAVEAIQLLQGSMLDGNQLELQFSKKATLNKAEVERKKSLVLEQKTAKFLVRNIPFEINQREVTDLFKDFGGLKSVRLPKKLPGEGTHRGFAFVEFTNKNNAKRAFDALCHSTHLLGRRLVLEWANPNSEDVTELRRKTAKDYFGGGPSQKLKKTKLRDDLMLSKPAD